MSAEATLYSDLYTPTLQKEFLGFEFFTSLGVLENLVGTDENAPVRLTNFHLIQNGGQYINAPVYKQVSNLITRTDETSFAAVDTKKLESRNDKGVRCAARIGPLSITQNAAQISGQTKEQLAFEFARQAARGVREHLQKAIVYTAKGAVAAMTTSAHTHSVWNAVTKTNLNTQLLGAGINKMGDRADAISAFLFRSESKYDLFTNQINAGVAGIADNAAGTGNVLTLGRKYQTVDEAALKVADAGHDKFYSLGFGAGAIEIEFTSLTFQEPFVNVTGETVQWIFRGDMEFIVRVPGMAYDVVAGGANPTVDASGLGAAANWDVTYTDAREVKMIEIEHNSTAA